ncbi:ArsR family transcriptional regulator [Candidatus Thorarchaeota archaeon]|nr:MAG: ArsR family transcriptional regulator [Candidatus Thorarchaeota archaeon]
MSKKKKIEYQDVISFKPAPLKVLSDEVTVKTLTDPTYYPIIGMLRRGPMTVKEIEKEYSKNAKKFGLESKSDKTIYRYLKHLEKHGLIAPAGKRVFFGKTATETLFVRTGDMFHFRDFAPEWWDTEPSLQFAQGIAAATEDLFQDCKLSPECVLKIVKLFEEEKEARIREFVAQDDARVKEFTSVAEFTKIELALQYVGIFAVLVKYPNIIEKIEECCR